MSKLKIAQPGNESVGKGLELYRMLALFSVLLIIIQKPYTSISHKFAGGI